MEKHRLNLMYFLSSMKKTKTTELRLSYNSEKKEIYIKRIGA